MGFCGISALIKETWESSLTPSTMCGHSQKVTIREPGGHFSPNPDHSDALISDF